MYDAAPAEEIRNYYAHGFERFRGCLTTFVDKTIMGLVEDAASEIPVDRRRRKHGGK